MLDYRKERSDWNKLGLTAGCKARLGEIYIILRPKRIFNAIETHDSLKFLSWKYASNEPNYKILRPMIFEILESKDNYADEAGPILKQNSITQSFLKIPACFIDQNFCIDHVHRLTHNSVPIRPFSSIID